MSETKSDAKKTLTKELLNNQIKTAEQMIDQAQHQVISLQNSIQQNVGVIGFAKHVLATFEVVDKVEEPIRKPELEVK